MQKGLQNRDVRPLGELDLRHIGIDQCESTRRSAEVAADDHWSGGERTVRGASSQKESEFADERAVDPPGIVAPLAALLLGDNGAVFERTTCETHPAWLLKYPFAVCDRTSNQNIRLFLGRTEFNRRVSNLLFPEVDR